MLDDNKRRIYWLMDQYLANKIDGWIFCDQYHSCYNLHLDLDTLTDLEHNIFNELGTVVGRFTDIEEDIRLHPGTYFTAVELRKKVTETKKILSEN